VAKTKSAAKTGNRELVKCRTGIQGLDEITFGGLPRGRPTLVCGGAGCGKTLLAMEFIARGAGELNEPGVYMSFEENVEELVTNFASLGFSLDDLIKSKKMILDYVFIERSEIEETGEYDLEGLFVRLGSAVDAIGAKRVVLDTIEALFSGLRNENILRAELRRLFRWLKTKGVTAIITGERGESTLTRYGLEEYVADCVILLDHRMAETVSTRRVKIIKYRGSRHGTNEYPFLIDKNGLSVLPITSLELNHSVSTDKISTGIKGFDEMLSGNGFYRGSTILVSGGAGTGKTSIAAHLVEAACGRGEKCLYFAFEESQNQLIRDMHTIGMDLDQWVRKGLLCFSCSRPQLFGLEMHLVQAHTMINAFTPAVVVLDPISGLVKSGSAPDAQSMMTRLIDFLKASRITLVMTALSASDAGRAELGISSLSDAWVNVQDAERGNERTRIISILKSRGMKHSSRMREFLITDKGVHIKA
jgi:circadian clock protein KaiC